MELNLWTALKKYRTKRKRLKQLEESVVMACGTGKVRVEACSFGTNRWREFDTILLKDVVQMILDHLDLEIAVVPPTEKSVYLSKKLPAQVYTKEDS